MLMRTDPFRELDRTQQVFGTAGTPAHPAVVPMDAWRDGNQFVVEFDLPGVDAESIDLNVERNMITVKAERTPHRDNHVDLVAAERPLGLFTRQLLLAATLGTEQIAARYDDGVLTLRIPVAERAKPRKISVTANSKHAHAIEAS